MSSYGLGNRIKGRKDTPFIPNERDPKTGERIKAPKVGDILFDRETGERVEVVDVEADGSLGHNPLS